MTCFVIQLELSFVIQNRKQYYSNDFFVIRKSLDYTVTNPEIRDRGIAVTRRDCETSVTHITGQKPIARCAVNRRRRRLAGNEDVCLLLRPVISVEQLAH